MTAFHRSVAIRQRLAAGIGALLLVAASGTAMAAGPLPAATPTPSPIDASVAAVMSDPATPPSPDPNTRNGLEIYQTFRAGLADPECAPDVSSRWSRHFAAAPTKLARRDDTLALFGYVVDTLRQSGLPTEYALIPFVESGYKPGARSPLGPAGLWQMIQRTARNHQVPIRPGFDGRLSPVESTRAAVRYLKTLHGMFAGDWRLAVMAYNAGEYRVLKALKQGGQVARDAQPEKLPGMASITHAYVRKLHALSCLMEQGDEHAEWLVELDRPVPRLEAVVIPRQIDRVGEWAALHQQDAERLRKLNPAFPDGVIRHHGDRPMRLLAVAGTSTSGAVMGTNGIIASTAPMESGAPAVDAAAGRAGLREHTVVKGDSLWSLARAYKVKITDLLQRNGLNRNSVLRPGVVLRIDATRAGDSP